MAMVESDHPQECTKPQVLVLKPPSCFGLLDPQIRSKFQILKAWESPLPTNAFLTAHAHSVSALLCSGFTPIGVEVLDLLPSLKLVVTTSAGLNHIDLTECRSRGIAVANAGTVFSEDVADMAVGLLLDVVRKITAADRYLRRALWLQKGDFLLGSKLSGKRVGIVGLGSIGSEVAKRLEAFGCIISYNSRKKKPSVPYPFYSGVSALAAFSDILIICCALTDETRHMINREVLLALGKEGVVVNIARGDVIDEGELVQCLVEGEIAGVGLDVFENEPAVPKELLPMDNVVLTPHMAVFTQESHSDLCGLLVGNLEAFFAVVDSRYIASWHFILGQFEAVYMLSQG